MNILITQLTLEQINAAFLRLNRVINNNQASLQSQVTNIISSNIETKDKYNDTAIRALIDALTSRVTDNERDIMNLEGKTQDLSAKIANLSTVIANINCSYNPDTNTLTFTSSSGLATNYELKDTTYTFSFDTETQTLTVHNDLDGEDTSNDFVQQITGTTYTFTWNNGTLTIHDNLADTDTTIDLDSRYYTESEIDAFITDINNNHNALANRVTTIESKIPSAASSSNQLADKEYVNHSITTATATFRGTVETTSALAALTGDLNDYAFLKIYDETTHSYSYDRYKWVESGGDYGHWKYEYSIENTEFTAPQWEALNSGITCSLVDKITDVYNAKITLCQNGTCKGSFTLNQSSNQTITLDNSTVCAHSSTNINSDLPLLACCSSTTGTLEDAYFNPDVSVNTCCGRITACFFCFKKGGMASRRVIYCSKNYTGGTRCTAMDIRMFMECFSVCHCLSSGEQLDVKYPWADACNNCICWGTNCSINLTGASVTVLSNSYDSRLWNDSCGGWVDFSVRIQPRTGIAHTFTACKGSFSAVAATIACDNIYDYLAYQACLSRVCGATENADRPITFVDSGDGFKTSYYSCGCKLTFNACTGQLCLGPYTVLNPISCVGIQMNAPDSCVTDGVFINRNNGCSIGLRLGTNINRGFFDCEGGTGRWLTYYNATCEIHNLPQSFGCTSKTISIPAGATTYILIGCICSTLYSHGTKLGITVGDSNAVNEAELDMLLTTSDPTYFECNNINVKVSNYKKSRYGISGIGFISTNASGSSAWQCPVCVVLRVCNVSSSAENWHYDVFGLRVKNWTTDIQCLGSTAPTFTKLIPIPACCRSYTYSNASQDITGNICGTLNGCGIADIVNDSVVCAYSGLGASLNGESFTSSNGCLTLDDFSFDKVCDACVYCVSCGDVVRRIIEANWISNVGFVQRVGLGLDRLYNDWGYGLLSIGINDAGTCFTDYRFSCGGSISSVKCGTAQCITVLGRSIDNVYRCDLPRPGGTTAACKWYVQVCTSSCRNNRSDSVYISLYSMDATLNLNAPVQYYCGSYYGGLCYSKCSYTCSNAECFWLAYTGYYYPVLCSSRCFTVLQCTHTAPEGVTFSCFCDIVTAGVSGIQSIDFNGSSFTVSSGAATLEMTPDICYDTATSCMCVILGNQESTKVDLSSLASDHLVAYCGLATSYDRPLLTGPYGLADGCICKAYFSSGCPITFNACTGLLNVKGIICSQCYFRGPSATYTSYTWSIPSGTSSRPTVRLMYDITRWAKCATGQTPKGIVGHIYHTRFSGYIVSAINEVIALANYGRNGCPWTCCNTGCIKLVYDYSLGTIIDKPVIVYDSTNDKYWLGICTSGTSSHSIRFDGFMSTALEASCVLCTDSSGCLPTGWTFCTCGVRYLPGKCLYLYCGSTCKCAVDWNSCNICLSANAFNQYAEVDETTYPGVCCTGDVCQADIASFITMTDVDNCGFMKNFCVYCGSTCKCKISNAGCLKLCANAFNANAQISTSTYPGACCTGNIQGICLNGEEFTTVDGIASLDNFYPVCLCQWKTTNKSLVLTDEDNHLGYSCGCPIKYNQCTGSLWACILQSCCVNFEPATNTCGYTSVIKPALSSNMIEFTTGCQGWSCTGYFGTCRTGQSSGYSYFAADRMCGDLGCLCCVHSELVCSDKYEVGEVGCEIWSTGCNETKWIRIGCVCHYSLNNIVIRGTSYDSTRCYNQNVNVCFFGGCSSRSTFLVNSINQQSFSLYCCQTAIEAVAYKSCSGYSELWAKIKHGCYKYCLFTKVNDFGTGFTPTFDCATTTEPADLYCCTCIFKHESYLKCNGTLNVGVLRPQALVGQLDCKVYCGSACNYILIGRINHQSSVANTLVEFTTNLGSCISDVYCDLGSINVKMMPANNSICGICNIRNSFICLNIANRERCITNVYFVPYSCCCTDIYIKVNCNANCYITCTQIQNGSDYLCTTYKSQMPQIATYAYSLNTNAANCGIYSWDNGPKNFNVSSICVGNTCTWSVCKTNKCTFYPLFFLGSGTLNTGFAGHVITNTCNVAAMFLCFYTRNDFTLRYRKLVGLAENVVPAILKTNDNCYYGGILSTSTNAQCITFSGNLCGGMIDREVFTTDDGITYYLGTTGTTCPATITFCGLEQEWVVNCACQLCHTIDIQTCDCLGHISNSSIYNGSEMSWKIKLPTQVWYESLETCCSLRIPRGHCNSCYNEGEIWLT